MRKLAILWMFLAIILTGCKSKIVGTSTNGGNPWVKKIDSEELSRIMINFSVKMKIDKHLELEDSWAAYHDSILKLAVRYSSQRTLTVYDARLLLVEVVEELLYRLNNHTIISFELDHFPFTANDLDIKINFESFYGRYVDDQYVGMVWLQGGCSHFYAFNRKDPTLIGIDWDDHRFEPYSKSRELALIKRMADLPYIQHIENPNPVRKSHSGSLNERYISPNK
ncbi:MAG: hypothetical protein ACH350_04935 [Parachlamydiaceae bacterium]